MPNTAYPLKAISLALMLVASSGVTAQDLQPPSTNDKKARLTVALTTGFWGSQLQENLTGSSRHVYERANLPIVAIDLIRDTDKNLINFKFQSSRGNRKYVGWTNTGQPITSTSDIEMVGVQAEYQWKLSPELSWGVRAEHELLDRQLNGVSNIKGYLEDYSGLALLAGLTKTIRFSADNTLNLAAWYGGGKGHKMKLTLHPYEPASVKLGNMRKIDFTATWKSPLDGGDQSRWNFIGQLGFTKSETGRSEVGILKNQGGSTGTFIQPSTESSGWRLAAGIAYTW